MNKIIASAGIVLILISGFLFLITFSGGGLLGRAITGTDPTLNFLAFFFVILFLPIGSGLAFYGLAYRTRILAAGAGQVVRGGASGAAKAGLALAVIAIIIGAGAFVYALPALANQSSQITSLNSQLSSLSSKPSAASINRAPGVVAYKIDWSNTDPTGQDRFNPETITVVQGDIVQIMFVHNDTDAHTFTMYAGSGPTATPYGFQINDTDAGMRDFLTSINYNSSCVNGNYGQDTSGLTANGVSTVYCVSGLSLLSPTFLTSHGAANFRIAVNPNPAEPLTPNNASGNPTVITLPIDNQVHIVPNSTAAANAGNGTAEIFGIGAFQATTPGVFEYFCDYHVSNGMFGYLIVLPNAYCYTNAGSCNSTSTA